jgi:LPS export ABC transporter protein LptC
VKFKITLITIVVIALLGGGLYYFLKTEPLATAPPDAPEAQSTDKVAMTLADNKITEEENGKILWELTADAIEVDPVTQNVLLHKVQGTFYSDKGTTLVVTSQEGSLDSQTKNVQLTGAVHAVASDGGDLTAPELLWQDQTKLLLGNGGVKVVKGSTILTGDKLEGDSVLNKIKVTGHAHVVTKEDSANGL